MHQILVAAGWWTAISVCAVPVWMIMFEALGRRDTPSLTARQVRTLRKRSA